MGSLVVDDDSLLQDSLAGDRTAFARIVQRYQNLVCAVAYSSLGDLGRSEDVAQETFVTAWTRLAEVREPDRLRGWLCGIARNQSLNARRRLATDVSVGAGSLSVHEPVAKTASEPVDLAIAREEETVLWSVLQSLPETYREPLVLYYRTEHSVAEVAAELELSEDAVKQRLARGRKLLSEEVAAFVDATLRRSRPGKAFAIAVLAALPATAPQMATAAIVAAAGKGAAAKGAAVSASAVAMLLGPIVGLLGAVAGVTASIRAARSPRERRFIIRMTYVMVALVASLFAAQAICFTYYPATYGTASFQVALWSIYIATLTGLVFYGNRRCRDIQTEDGTLPTRDAKLDGQPWDPERVWSFRWGLFGAMIGSVAWIVPMGFQADDPWAATMGLIAVVVGWELICRWFARDPREARQHLALLAGTALVGVAAITVTSLRWTAWQSDMDHPANQASLWAVNSIVAVVVGGMVAYFAVMYRRARRRLGKEKK
jgi:RNA polymerase sigma factor (sigma-70 family)